MSRVVLFAEVPQFYASVERARDPSLRDRPVLVGGDPRKRGLLQAATPDALAAGVTLEMNVLEALQVCPRARALRTDMAHYREMSRRLFASLRRGFARLEPFGLGAAYFDLSGAADDPERVARHLVEGVAEDPGLPLRVGIASSRFVARLAGEEVSGAGVRRIAPGAERAFLDPQPVARLDGVGEKTAARLAELGARSIGDVVALGRERLQEAFGTHGLRIHGLALGGDDGPVRARRHPQSLSREATLGPGQRPDWGVLGDQLGRLTQDLAQELERQGLAAGRIALRLRYADAGSASRSRTLARPIASAAELRGAAAGLLDRLEAGSRPVRGLGVQLGRLAPVSEKDRQLELFRPQR